MISITKSISFALKIKLISILRIRKSFNTYFFISPPSHDFSVSSKLQSNFDCNKITDEGLCLR